MIVFFIILLLLLLALLLAVNVEHDRAQKLERENSSLKKKLVKLDGDLTRVYKKLNDAENCLLLEVAKTDGLTAEIDRLNNMLKIKQQIINKLEKKGS